MEEQKKLLDLLMGTNRDAQEDADEEEAQNNLFGNNMSQLGNSLGQMVGGMMSAPGMQDYMKNMMELSSNANTNAGLGLNAADVQNLQKEQMDALTKQFEDLGNQFNFNFDSDDDSMSPATTDDEDIRDVLKQEGSPTSQDQSLEKQVYLPMDLKEKFHPSLRYGVFTSCFPLNWTVLFEEGKEQNHVIGQLVNFTNLPLITDAILYSWYKNKSEFENVREITLGRCQKVTDVGLKWLGRLVKESRKVLKVNVDGCENITTFGLLQFLEPGQHRFLTLKASGTGVVYKHEELWKSNGTKLELNESLTLDRGGSEEETKSLKYSRILVCPPDSLIGKTIPKLHFMDSSSGEHHNVAKLDDWTLNIMEAPPSHVSFDMFTRGRVSNVVVPVDCHAAPEVTRNHLITVLSKFVPKELHVPQMVKGANYTILDKGEFLPVGGLGADYDPSTRLLRIDAGSTEYPQFVSSTNFSRKNHCFSIEVVEAKADSLSIGLGVTSYEPNFDDVSTENESFEKPIKAGQVWTVGIKEPEKLLYNEIPVGSSVTMYIKCLDDSQSATGYPEFYEEKTIKWTSTLNPFVFCTKKNTLLKMLSIPEPPTAEKDMADVMKRMQQQPIHHFLSRFTIFDPYFGIIRCDDGERSSEHVIWRSGNSVSIVFYRFEVEILSLPEDTSARIGVGGEIAPDEIGLGGNGSSIAWCFMDKKIVSGRRVKDADTAGIGDRIAVEITNFEDYFPVVDAPMTVTFYKNGENVGGMQWTCRPADDDSDEEDQEVPPNIIFMLSMLKAGTSFKIIDYVTPYYLEKKEKFMQLKDTNLHLSGSQLSIPENTDHGNFIASNQVTRDHPQIEIRINSSETADAKNVMFGFVHSCFSVKRIPDEDTVSAVYWNLASGKVHQVGEADTEAIFGDNQESLAFRVMEAKFNEHGLITPMQTIKLARFKNGVQLDKELLSHEYLGGGLHPFVCMNDSSKKTKVRLLEYHDVPLTDILHQENDDKEGHPKTSHGAGGKGSTSSGTKFILLPMDSTKEQGNLVDVMKQKLKECNLQSAIADMIKRIKTQQEHFEALILSETMDLQLHDEFAAIVHAQENWCELLDHWNERILIADLNEMHDKNISDLQTVLLDNLNGGYHRSPFLFESPEYYHFKLQGLLSPSFINKKICPVSDVVNQSDNPVLLMRWLCHIHDLGIVILAEDIDPPSIVTDLEWFVKVIWNLPAEPTNVTSTEVRAVDKDTPSWKDRELWKLAMKKDSLTEHQMSLLFNLLIESGHLIRLPCFRQHYTDTKSFIVNPLHLRSLPVSMSKFYSKDFSDRFTFLEVKFHFVSQPPSSLLASLLAACVHFCQPIALGKDGLAFHSGPVEVVVLSLEEENAISIHGKIFYEGNGSDVATIGDQKVKNILWNTLTIYSDIIACRLNKWSITYWRSISESDRLTPSGVSCVHHWDKKSKPGGKSVCNICGNCSEKGLTCENNGLPSQVYQVCPCRTAVTCCQDCGICQACATRLWNFRSQLRPCLVTHKGHDSVTLNTATLSEVHFAYSTAQHVAGFMTTSICLKMKSHRTNFEVYPNAPQFCELNKVNERYKRHEGVLKAKQGDVITVRIKDVPEQDVPVLEAEEAPAAKRYNYFQSRFCRLWQANGLLSYRSGSTSTIPVALLLSQRPIRHAFSNYIEIEIVDEGAECTLAVGIVPPNYGMDRSSGMQPGWGHGSVGYHADDGGIFFESGGLTQRAGTCTVGDRMGVGVMFPEDVLKPAKFFFTKNGQKVFEKNWFALKDGTHHLAVGMHSLGEKAVLLDSDMWLLENDDDTMKEDVFALDSIMIKPKSEVIFPDVFSDNEPQRPSKKRPTRSETSTAFINLQNSSDGNLIFKVKTTDPKRYTANPFVGVLMPFRSENVKVTAKVKPGENIHDAIMNDKFLIQWKPITREVDPESKTDEIRALFDDVGGKHSNHKLTIGWKKPKINLVNDDEEEDNVTYLTSTSEPPVEKSYRLEVLKNGEQLHSCWLPYGSYTVGVDTLHERVEESKLPHRFSSNYPTLDLFLSKKFLPGMILLADTNQKKITGEAKAYSPMIVTEVLQDGSLKLETSNKSYQVTVPSDSPDIHPIHWFFYNTEPLHLPWLKNGCIQEPKETWEMKPDVSDDKLEDLISERTCSWDADIGYASLAAPTHLFNKTQKAKCPDHPIWSFVSMKRRCAAVDTFQIEKNYLSSIEQEIYSWVTPSMKCDCTKVLTALPTQLDLQNLQHPPYSVLFDLKNLALHQLCKSNDSRMLSDTTVHSIPHLMDRQGLQFTSPPSAKMLFEDLMTAWTYASLAVSGVRLPACRNLVSLTDQEFKDYKLNIERLMTHLVDQYAMNVILRLRSHQKTLQELVHDTENGDNLRKLANWKDDEVQLPENIGEIDTSKLLNGCCIAHHFSDKALKVPADHFKHIFVPLGQLLRILNLVIADDDGGLPEDFAQLMCDLEVLNITESKMKALPQSMFLMNKLKVVEVSSAEELIELPGDIGDCPNLQVLNVSRSLLSQLPVSLTRCKNLTNLELRNTRLKAVPDGFGKLKNLSTLDLSNNNLGYLPSDFQDLSSLKILLLNGIPWLKTESGVRYIDQEHYIEWHDEIQQYNRILDKQTVSDIFTEGDVDKNGLLESTEVAAVSARLFYSVTRFGHDYEEWDQMGRFPIQLTSLTSLTRLELDYQAIRQIPSSISSLINLEMLSLNHCVMLESLPGTMGYLPVLNTLQLRGCPSLRTPPNEVVSRGTEAVLAYLKRLSSGFTENWRTKLMLVGLGGAGKTSLLKAFKSGKHMAKGTTDKEVTDGIDIVTLKMTHPSGQQLTFSAWDFAGQSVYYNTHQFFLSNRAVYLLLWNSRQGYEHAGLEFWLSSIRCHAPKAPVFVIGTHCDQVPKADIPRDVLKKLYPQIVSFHFVSGVTGKGVKELEDEILEATYHESYMSEKVPKVYLDLENKILSSRNFKKVLKWQDVQAAAIEVGIYDDKDIGRAVQFLHDLGTVQYFDSEFLRDHVVIDPQWIVDVMACVVSIKDSPVMDGRLYHRDIPQVWSEFPKELHEWLLKLTEAFDLTFPIPDEPVNLIPCLLPPDEPQFEWPDIMEHTDWRETNMIYKFAYLPAGLFNRTQVRLFQFSDSKVIWKRGSLLHKNGHRAIVRQKNDTDLTVQVIGPRPENILFLVHEVIESLIAESFHGVSYDYLVPCPDCLKKCGVNDAYMFSCSLVRQAENWNAPFIQCRKYFHIISMAILQAVMPPDSSSEFDAHLQTSVQALMDLKFSLKNDIFVAFCPVDIPKDEMEQKRKIHPEKVVKDLEEAGYSCWYREDMWDLEVSERVMALQGSKVLLLFMSTEFEKEHICREFCLYAVESLNKPVVILSVGKTYDWRQTHTGYVLGSDTVFISMKEVDDFTRKLYHKRRSDLMEALTTKFASISTTKTASPMVFMSYCWTNSQDAVTKGTRPIEKAIGAVDPRDLKKEIENRGLSCWIDIEQTGQRGLFEDITEGIRDAKVIVACVSSQYKVSKNCMMELRFAACILQKPIVFAEVGTSDDWKWGEIGALMMNVKAPVISLQKSSDPALFDELVEVLKKHIPENESNEPKVDKVKKDQAKDAASQLDINNISYKEELELAQRKFHRHLAMLAGNMATVPFPYLIVIDFMDISKSANILPAREGSTLRPKTGKNRATVQEMLVKKSMENPVKDQPGSKRKTIERRTTSKLHQVNVKTDDWQHKMMCFKIFCENGQGWHVSNSIIEVPDLTPRLAEQLINSSAPYLVRMYVLLQHCQVPLVCLQDQHKSFLEYLKQVAQESDQDFGQAYCLLREAAIKFDKDRQTAGLARCLLPTGKVNWLCEDHRNGSHITILSSDIAQTAGQALVGEEDIMLRDAIIELEHLREPYRTRKDQKPATVQAEKIQAVPSQITDENKEKEVEKKVENEDLKPVDKKPKRNSIKKKFRVAGNTAQAAATLAGHSTSKACSIL